MGRLLRAGVRTLAIAVSSVCVVSCSSADRSPEAGRESWGLDVDQRFGGDKLALAHIYALAVGPDGVVAEVDGPPVRILLLSPDGSALPMGGQGAGPSEYGYVNAVGFSGDTLWATDARSSKGMLFMVDGRFLGSERISIPPAADSRAMGPIRRLSDGSWLVSEPYLSITRVMNDRAHDRTFLRYAGAGEIDTVYIQPLAKTDFMRVRLQEDGALEGMHPVPQRPLLVSDVVSTGFWVVDRASSLSGDTASFRIHRITPSGDTAWSASLHYQPEPISDQWVSGWYEARAGRLADAVGLTPARLEAAFREAVPFPAFFPPVSDAISGRDGRLWLREWHADTLRSDWLVLDSLGRQAGRVSAPPGFRILAADSNQVWGVLKDSLDVEEVVRANIVRTARPSAPPD